MSTKLSVTEWRELNDAVIPEISTWVDNHAGVLSERGQKFAGRALEKATLRGSTGARQLVEPVLLIASAAGPMDISNLLPVCNAIPFTGNYGIWDAVRTMYASIYRTMVQHDGPHDVAREAWLMLSYPENGEQKRAPLSTAPERNRANGSGVGYSANYPRPATTVPALQHLLGAVREWTIMWAYGISEEWPRTRLDNEIASAMQSASTFLR